MILESRAVMNFFDYLYIVAIIFFAFMTFMIIKRNFESKFNENGERKDLVEKKKRDEKN